jgi:magnesium chelatase family protein
MTSKLIKKHCKLDKQGSDLLKQVTTKLGLSARAYDRILKTARTIADLDASENIEYNHIAEASRYRNLDKDGWAGK